MVWLDAACLSDMGKVRLNNEDNLLFHRTILDEFHTGLERPLVHSGFLIGTKFFAVFDGMGGEANGEVASFAAARCAKELTKSISVFDSALPEALTQICRQTNMAVFQRAQSLLCSRMGTTLAMACFSNRYIYVCNLGDSKVFRLRDGRLEQLSEDHTDEQVLKVRGINRKPGLTQYLGIDPEELSIEPYFASLEIKRKDIFLICSDGLTDMLSNEEIAELLATGMDSAQCAKALVQAALESGGKDNVTVIVCRIR